MADGGGADGRWSILTFQLAVWQASLPSPSACAALAPPLPSTLVSAPYQTLQHQHQPSRGINPLLTIISMLVVLGLSMRCLAKHPGEERLVRITLFLGWAVHWTNRSRENPHSRSGTLTSTACSGA